MPAAKMTPDGPWAQGALGDGPQHAGAAAGHGKWQRTRNIGAWADGRRSPSLHVVFLLEMVDAPAGWGSCGFVSLTPHGR